MISLLANLNWIGILLAFAAYFLLGALWYMLLFPKQYRISLGRENETLKSNAPIFIVGPAVCVLVITIVSAVLIHALNIQHLGDALEFAVVVGFGYLFTNTVNIGINPNIPRPILYGIITGTYHLLGMLIACTILIIMK
jgi:hypothetical protein